MKKVILIVGVLVFLGSSYNPPTRGQQAETANSEVACEQAEETFCKIERLSHFPLIGNTIGFVELDLSGNLDTENKIEILNDDGTIWHSFCADAALRDFLIDWNDGLFRPWISAFEVGGLIMRCIAKSEDYYYVVVNEQTNLVKRVRKRNDLLFQTVEEHVLGALVWTDFDINPLRMYPSDDAQVIDYAYASYYGEIIVSIKMNGDWIKIIEAFSEEVLGWIRWRKEDRFMVWLFYSI